MANVNSTTVNVNKQVTQIRRLTHTERIKNMNQRYAIHEKHTLNSKTLVNETERMGKVHHAKRSQKRMEVTILTLDK